MTRKPRKTWQRRVVGFSLVELLVVIAIIAILIGILVPALGLAKTTAQKANNAANVRSTMQSFMLLANSNDDRRPIDTVLKRFQRLVDPESDNGMALSPNILVSPGEKNVQFYRKASSRGEGSGLNTNKIELLYSPNVEVNYSYSLLNSKNNEWTQSNSNASAVLMADRIANDGATIPNSTDGSNWNLLKWEGHVGWGDTHVDFKKSKVMPTNHGGSTMGNDDIFRQDSTNNALLTHPGESSSSGNSEGA